MCRYSRERIESHAVDVLRVIRCTCIVSDERTVTFCQTYTKVSDNTACSKTADSASASEALFAFYIKDSLSELAHCGIGCNVGVVFYNVLAYADDMVLLTPSWSALQRLLDIFSSHIHKIDMICNINKKAVLSQGIRAMPL